MGITLKLHSETLIRRKTEKHQERVQRPKEKRDDRRKKTGAKPQERQETETNVRDIRGKKRNCTQKKVRKIV